MGMPKKVKFLGKQWSIERPKKLRKGKYGDCDPDSLRVRVSRNKAEGQQRDTLAHELTHSIDIDLSLGLSEKKIHRIATTWLALLRDNPALVKYLMS